ncbi:hypothetical protein H8D36_00975 [archaeon]|nr:hypothetical protein [archaeon]
MKFKKGERFAQDEQVEFPPWMDEFRRIGGLVVMASEISVEMLSGNIDSIPEYYAVLTELYNNVRALIYNLIWLDEWDARSLNMKTLYKDWLVDKDNGFDDELPEELVEFMQEFHRDILMLKQKIGLGIPIRMRFDKNKSKMKKLMEG